jgi:hypothetical protein
MSEKPQEDDNLAEFLDSQTLDASALDGIKEAHSKNPVKRRRFDSREQAFVGLLVGGLGMSGLSLYNILTMTPGPNMGARMGGLIGGLVGGLVGTVVGIVLWARSRSKK